MLKLNYMDITSYVVLTLLLGFLPPIIWLWFWLREDVHPEPKREIVLVFVAGMVSVVFAILLEHRVFALNSYMRDNFGYVFSVFQLINIIAFAFVEEIVKMAAAFFTALRSRYFDEPVDAMIYLVTAALGFAALENVLFVAESLRSGLQESIMVGSFRFVNAVLLHVSASSLIGAGFAFSFFHKERRVSDLILGTLLAVLLHVAYNFLIINSVWSASTQFFVTLLIIAGAGTALVLFERARRILTY